MIQIGQREFNPADVVGVRLANGRLSVTRVYHVPIDRNSPPTETVPFTETVTFTGPNILDDYQRTEQAMIAHHISDANTNVSELTLSGSVAGYVPHSGGARPIINRTCQLVPQG
ncbi:unnamed protein product [Gemmata massiliana]|uniref:Uncharacterized protein n=1 Tax=Gemmata massiliana TaxID=1210884 RepID=A0A6P2DGC0_9BACT|nr:hypothetical protein [Gemmata massiliana]VTR97939.1 unnamed protein product [Gemmata massiliana]VTR98852.1 unnamed protein product [Gemmata massiliana]